MKTVIKIQLFLAVPLLIAGGFFAYFIWNAVYLGLEEPVSEVEVQTGGDFYRNLDGTASEEEDKNLLPFAVMIENHIDARPQSGLSKARIVYEVLTEGSITRFLAIYDLSENIEAIGPIRSARPYFIDIASEYSAVYAHSGGSPESLSLLKRSNYVFDLDEFFGYNTGYFKRSDSRYAPHNLYTSLELLVSAKNHYQLKDDAEFEPWLFKDPTDLEAEVIDIVIDYSGVINNQVSWKYLLDNNKYERSQDGRRHVDEDGSLIEADNVIVQFATTSVIDEIGRKDIRLIGEGRSIVFRDGIAIEGSWRKKLSTGRTVFYDESGNKIELNRGKTWIQVVPTDLEIEY
jgi:hypothetical protein